MSVENAPRQEEDSYAAPERPPTDIQAILTVIGRRETTGKNRGTDRLDLNHTRLTRANLYEADLRGAILHGANLTGAYLTDANLSGANLTDANLSGARPAGANLSGASLPGADLLAANLYEANLYEANLDGAILDARIFGGAKNLTAAQVQSARSCYGATLPDYLPDSVKDLTKRPPISRPA